MKLLPRIVEKPWGRTDLPSSFGGASRSPIGEVWFEHPDAQDLPLLVKYIFTSEKLSVQVHPDDDEAHKRGLARGKNEGWYILDGGADASLGLGLTAPITSEELRASAVDGSIEQLMEWHPVKAGDFFYVPAGTIHAIGAGITLLEVQQNSDVTYRLFDYGRPRELHLEDGIAVSKLEKYSDRNLGSAGEEAGAILLDGPYFGLVRATSPSDIPLWMSGKQRWVVPIQGRVHSDGDTASPGECLLLGPHARISFSRSAVVLIAVESMASIPSG